MKKVVATLILLTSTLLLKAQVVPAKSDPIGTVYTYKTISQGIEMSQAYTYLSREGNTFVLKTEVTGENLPKSFVMETYVTVEDGAIVQSIENARREMRGTFELMGMSNVDIEMEGDNYSIPLEGEVGDIFPARNSEAKVSVMGITQKIKVETPIQKIVGKEKVETPAGIFDCIVLEIISTSTMKTMGMTQKEESTQKIWLHKERGMIKSETVDSSGNRSITELQSIVKP